MIGNRLICQHAVFDGGIDDPRTRVYLYQQRLRAELLAKADGAVRQPSWVPALPVARPAVRPIMALRRATLAATDPAVFPQRYFLWAFHRPRHRPGLITLQGRLLGAIAAGFVGRGTLFDIAARLATGKEAVVEALRALKDGGWIAIQFLPEEQMVVRLERRRTLPRPPLVPPLVANRRLHVDAWAL